MKKLFILLCIFQSLTIFPCSIFSYKINGNIFFCANEDWTANDPAIMTIKSTKSSYGVVLFGWNSYLPNYAQAGINSEGLCFDWASVPSQSYIRIKDKKVLDINSTTEMLQQCKTIEEAIKYITNCNFPHIAEEHLMLCDKETSCVIEYTKGQLQIIWFSGISQYITNFDLTDKKAGWYPCSRYSIMESELEKKDLNETDLINVLNNTHQKKDYPTQYSYIINVNDLSIRIFTRHQFSSSKIYKVQDLLVNNKKISM